MKPSSFRRVLAPLPVAAMLAACSGCAKNPYAEIADAPLVRARLHTAVLLTGDSGLIDRLRGQGYSRLTFSSNYPAAVRVESALWDVPEDVAADPAYLAPQSGRGPNLCVLAMQPEVYNGPPPSADAGVMRAFFRNVLGTEVPGLPDFALTGGTRIRVWTYLIDDVVVAARRLRAAGIPVAFSPVGVTTAYLGDHRTMAIRAPDDTLIELVQAAAN